MTTHRTLIADPKKCNGCSLCRTVCSMVKSGARNPAQARIRIIRDDAEGQYLPVICQHCQDAPCMVVCPREAIYRDGRLDRVLIDYDRCISCRMCMAACPFGALGFESERQTVYKCDLCGGDPLCVRYCFPGALDYIENYRQQNARIRKAAGIRAQGRRGGNAKIDRSYLPTGITVSIPPWPDSNGTTG